MPAQAQTRKFHVSIVDDHFATRDGYKYLFRRFTQVSRVTCFESVAGMLEELKQDIPDLVLLDIELKNEDGLEMCKLLKQRFRNIRVLVISSYHNRAFIIKADEYEADGFLFKDASPDEVKNAFEKIMLSAGQYYNSEAKEVLFDHHRSFTRTAQSPRADLTIREIQIVRLICDGKSNKGIAALLSREETTIAKHRQNIMSKMGVHKTIGIYNYAIKHGYYSPKSAVKEKL